MQRQTNNRRNRRGRRGDAQQQRSYSDKTIALLKSIDSKQTLQENGVQPRVPDVTMLTLRRRKIYTVNKTVAYNQLVGSTTAETSTPYGFRLSDTLDSASYTTVFDNWRIAQVTLKFIPLIWGSSITTNGSSGALLTTAIDYDDATALGTGSLIEYDTAMQTPPGQTHVRVLNPCVQTTAFVGATPVQTQAPRTLWIDCAQPSVVYYGLKAALGQLAASTSQVYNVSADIVFQFQNTR